VIRIRAAALPQTTAGKLRLAVVAVAAVATILKIYIAYKTLGTDDVWLFQNFAWQVRKSGPIGIYGAPPPTRAPYNHPPLIGWMLLCFNVLVDHGARMPLLIRLPATLSDFITALLLFELIRTRRPVREAAVGAGLFALSPALGVISGFHGNTDPVAIMFAVLALYLLVIRDAPTLAGISYAVGLGVKLVPIVLGPLLLFIALRAGGRRWLAFLAGSAAATTLIWLPPLLRHFTIVRKNVIGYAGFGPRQWGPAEFAARLGAPPRWIELYGGPGRFLVLLLCAGVPVLLAWRRPNMTLPAAGLSLAMFLLITPAHAMQYTIWPVAAMYLMNIWTASVYSLAGGLLLLKVYSRWNHAVPWHWQQAWASGMDRRERDFAVVVWLVLLITTIVGTLPRFNRATPQPSPDDELPGSEPSGDDARVPATDPVYR